MTAEIGILVERRKGDIRTIGGGSERASAAPDPLDVQWKLRTPNEGRRIRKTGDGSEPSVYSSVRMLEQLKV